MVAPVPYGLQGLRRRSMPVSTAAGLRQRRPGLSPLQSALGGGLRGTGQLLMQLGVGRPDLAGQAFSSGLDQFNEGQRQNAADAMNAEQFGWERTKYQDEQNDRASDKATAAQQKSDFDSAVDQLVVTGAIDAAEGDAIKAGVMKYEKPKAKDSPWKLEKFKRGGQEVTAWVNGDTQEVRDFSAGPAFAPDKGNGGDYGLQLYYTKDPAGKLHAWQPGRDGRPIEVALPEGQSFAPGVQYLDTGTGFVPVDKRGASLGTPETGAPAAVPKDVEGKAAAEAVGTATGKAVVDLPGVENNARYITDTIDALITAPGREAATGFSSILNPLAIPGSDRKDFLVQRDQLKGQAFLNAYDNLRGGGQITEIEGAKAEQAKARLDTAQTEEAFLAALKEFKVEVAKLVEIARKKAKQPAAPTAPQEVDELPGEGWE